MIRWLAAAAWGVLLVCSTGSAQAATFNFEGLTPTTGGALTSLSNTQDGLTLTLTRSGATFDLVSTSSLITPSTYGAVTLSTASDTQSTTPFIANFSAPLTSISIDVGDIGSDADTIVLRIFSALNASGTELGTQTAALPAADFATFTGTTLSFSSLTPFLSVSFIGGSTLAPSSVFYDNIVATVAPVPGPLAGAGLPALLGLGGLVWARRRKASAA